MLDVAKIMIKASDKFNKQNSILQMFTENMKTTQEEV